MPSANLGIDTPSMTSALRDMFKKMTTSSTGATQTDIAMSTTLGAHRRICRPWDSPNR